VAKTAKGVFFICSGCSYAQPEESGDCVCPNCGENLISECPECGTSITNPFVRFCWRCGRSLRAKESEERTDAQG
jgi:hypothetical protein